MTSYESSRTRGLFAARSFRAGPLAVRSPIDGAEIARVMRNAAVGNARRSSPALEIRLRGLARSPGAAPGRACAAARRGVARRQGVARRGRDAGGGQDRLRGPGRSAGDDRHLRFRGRPVAADLRPDHRLGASRPPHDGDLASARALRGHLRLQLPGRGLGMERGARARVRRSRHLEALGKDAAERARGDEGSRPGARALRRRRAGRAGADRHRRSGDRRGAGRLEGRADRVRDRFDPHGRRRSARRWPPASDGPSSNSAATTP